MEVVSRVAYVIMTENCLSLFTEDGWWEGHFIRYSDTPRELPGQPTKLSITVCYGFSILQYTNDMTGKCPREDDSGWVTGTKRVFL